MSRGRGAKSRASIPTEADWADTSRDDGLDIDRKYAKKMFGGLSHEQAVQRFFVGSILERIDELRWMPPIPFRFYLRAFLEYLRSEPLPIDAKRDLSRASVEEAADAIRQLDRSDAASAFLRLIEGRLERWPEDVRPVLDEVLPVVDFVAAHQSDFDASEDIYGSFPDLAARIHALAKRLRG